MFDISVEANLTDASELVLENAFFLYTSNETKALTVHSILEDPTSKEAIIGAGRLITPEEVGKMLHMLMGDSVLPTFLPPNIIASTLNTLIWYQPSQRRPLYFKLTNDTHNLNQHSGESVMQPALLFIAHRQKLSVFALEYNARPEKKTQLFYAPYYNTYTDHAVCLGTNPKPITNQATSTKEWEDVFFNTIFTHLNTKEDLIAYPGGLGSFWKSRYENPGARFPTKYLIPVEKTLENLLKVNTFL